MNADLFESPVEDYFQVPVCTDEVADLAYGKFVSQGAGAGNDFAHWLEAQAWLVTFRSGEHVADD